MTVIITGIGTVLVVVLLTLLLPRIYNYMKDAQYKQELAIAEIIAERIKMRAEHEEWMEKTLGPSRRAHQEALKRVQKAEDALEEARNK